MVRVPDPGAAGGALRRRSVLEKDQTANAPILERPLVRLRDHGLRLERRAFVLTIGPPVTGQIGPFQRRLERWASQSAAEAGVLRRYERWAFQGPTQ